MAVPFVIGLSAQAAPISDGLVWPLKQPSETRFYGLDITAELGTDYIAQISLAISPSGTGELSANVSYVIGNEILVELTQGVAGRVYLVDIDVQTGSGETIEFPVWIAVDPRRAVYPFTDPSSSLPGPPISWIYAPALNFSIPYNSENIVLF